MDLWGQGDLNQTHILCYVWRSLHTLCESVIYCDAYDNNNSDFAVCRW